MRKIFANDPFLMSTVMVLGAFGKILETISLVLPLKGIFILINPNILPNILTSRGIGFNEVMFFLTIALVFTFVLARLLQALADRYAKKVLLNSESGLSDDKVKLTVRLLSSLFAILLFLLIICIMSYPIALIIVGLITLASIFPVWISEIRFSKIFLSIMGANNKESQYRLQGSSIFIIFFILIVLMATLKLITVEVILLVTVLIARRLIQEYTRLRLTFFALNQLINLQV